MKLNEKKFCKYDAVSLGEVMLRFDPGESRLKCARSFHVWEGGGEYNVVRALSKVFGMNTAIVTSLVDNEIGRLVQDLMMQGGCDTSHVLWRPFDGIGKTARNGLNFVERGFGLRGALGVSDRANTAVSQLCPGEVDWQKLFGDEGVRWFHTGGIFTALSETTGPVALEAAALAKKNGSAVSFDFNYRPSLWRAFGDTAPLQAVNREIMRYTDVVFGNEFDFVNALGFAPLDDFDLNKPDEKRFRAYAERLMEEYPNIRMVLSTVRSVKSAGINDWSAIGVDKDGIYKSVALKDLAILDRVGGGDGFASGVIWALMNGKSTAEALNYGVCHGALAMTTPGDNSMASLPEVERLMNGTVSSVSR